METIITRAEGFQLARWFNLAIGLWQLHYVVQGASLFTAVIAAINIGVWVFTRKKD